MSIAQSCQWQPSIRLRKLYDDHQASAAGVGAERAIHYTEFYKRSAKDFSSPHLLCAHCLADHLARRTIQIHDDELIVGSHTEHRIGAICHIEKAGAAMLEDLLRFERRPVNPLYLEPKAKWTLLRKVIPYWLNRSLPMRAFSYGRKLRFLRELFSGTLFVVNEVGGVAHFLPDYGRLIHLGTDGLRRQIEARRRRDDLNQRQRDYLQASLVVLDALDSFAERYRRLAQRIGRHDVAAVLNQVPRGPARNLREALQMIWFFQLVIQIESLDQGISLGRMDQYLYGFYRDDVSADRADSARELFAAFSLKLSEVIPLFSSRVTEFFAGLPSGQALTLGGIDEQGNDAANELTMLLLDVIDGFKTRQPNWHARISSKSSPEYLDRVVSVIAGGGGSPALYNDDVIMPAMIKRGAPQPTVWNYATVGCVEPAPSGESFTSSDAAIVNLAVNLELVLGGGRRRDKGKRPDLSSINSLDELLVLLRESVDRQIDYLKDLLDSIERANAQHFPTPFSSLTVKGCIESATDLTAGGALYNASGIQAVGVADVANSLAVIETLVFREKRYSLQRIADACAANFAGEEMLRARAEKIAKFGNDDPLVDELANRVTALFDDSVSRHVNTRGGRWMPGFYAMTCHQGFGKRTGALPSGRLSGLPLADGLAPADGTDALGPTASLNSVARLDHERFGNGINLNIKFDARTVSGREGPKVLRSLVEGYFGQRGMQVQINVLDPAILLDAMRNPEKHRNLLVRISGYCAYFVDLTPEMRQEIINRTLQHAV